jgi:hypothetical protein
MAHLKLKLLFSLFSIKVNSYVIPPLHINIQSEYILAKSHFSAEENYAIVIQWCNNRLNLDKMQHICFLCIENKVSGTFR